MSKHIAPVLRPMNRHLTIVPHPEKEKSTSGVLLPEDYKPETQRHIVATVLDVSKDCCPALRSLRADLTKSPLIVVDKSMIEEVDIQGKKYFLILENYVLGSLRGINEG